MSNKSVTKGSRTYSGVKTVSLINGIGETRQIHALKNETRLPSYTTYKNKLKMD